LFDQVDANSLKFSVLTLPFTKIRFSKKKKKEREARLVITFEHTKGILLDFPAPLMIILGKDNHLDSGLVIRVWNQKVCFLCGLRFKLYGCSYDGHWRLTWSLTSGPVGLVEVRANWPGHPH